MTQYIISSLEQKDNRQRNDEFAAKKLDESNVVGSIGYYHRKSDKNHSKCTSNSFVKIRQVQGFEFSGLGVFSRRRTLFVSRGANSLLGKTTL